MFDLPFDFISVVIAIVALVVARKALNQVAVLRARLDAIEVSAPATATARAAPPPLPMDEAPVAPSAPSQTRIETAES